MDAVKLNYISQISIEVFSVLLSLTVTFLLYLLFSERRIMLKFEVKTKVLLILISLLAFIVGVLLLIDFDRCVRYGFMAFQPWGLIPKYNTTLVIILFCYLLYMPAYIFHKIFFKRFHISFLEKLVFYPLISTLFWGFTGFFFPPFKNVWFLKFFIPFLFFFSILFFAFTNNTKRDKESNIILNLNLVEISGLMLLIVFRLFIFYSGLEPAIFLKHDAAQQAGYVGQINRYGLAGYIESPLTAHYPVFYFLAWSSITKILPLPYCNILVMQTFFNQIFVTLAFYLLARKIFRNYREGLFSTFAFTILSGFSWLYLFTDPPSTSLSGSTLYEYVRAIHNKFGMYSGATVSTIQAFVLSLVRLWSLGVCFASMAALISSCTSGKWRMYLFIFTAGFLQIVLGHPTEVFLVVFFLFALALLPNTNIEICKKLVKLLSVLTMISLLLILVFQYVILRMCILATIFPLLLLISALVLRRAINIRSIKRYVAKLLNEKILCLIAIIFVYYYGLSWIAFSGSYTNVQICYPIFTLWYSPPIQWGFLGLLFTFMLIKSALTKKWDCSIYFNGLILILLTIFVVFINYINLYWFYTGLVYPIMPHFFLPFFALASGGLIKSNPYTYGKRRISIRLRKFLLAILIVSIFLLGSLCHVISASYWKNISWWYEKPLSTCLNDEETQLLNFLYNLTLRASYEEVCFIPENDPLPLVGGIAYQTIRYGWLYGNYCQPHIIRLSGMSPAPRLVDSALYNTRDFDEVLFLQQFSTMRLLLIDKNTKSPILQLMKERGVCVFESEKYVIYELQTSLPSRSEEAVLVDKVIFDSEYMCINEQVLVNVSGEILPLKEGYVQVRIKNMEDFIIASPNISIKGEVTLFNVRATRLYFPEALNVAQKIIFHGSIFFEVANTFNNKHLYLKSLRYADSYKIYPEPWHMTSRVAQFLIKAYIKANDIRFFTVLMNTLAKIWTIIIAVILIFVLFKPNIFKISEIQENLRFKQRKALIVMKMDNIAGREIM